MYIILIRHCSKTFISFWLQAKFVLSKTTWKRSLSSKLGAGLWGNKNFVGWHVFKRILLQCNNLEIPVYKELDQTSGNIVDQSHIILDALFGFSFKGEVRDPYQEIIGIFEKTTKPIVSVDIPSGWDVETGPTEHVKFQPNVLVSLTAPKQCLSHFKGKRHFLGGRFVPPALAKKFNFDVPDYPGSEQVVEL